MDQYLAGIDIGGTFTDCVVVTDDGTIITAKVPSTPPNFSDGVVDALSVAAEQLGLALPELCAQLRLVAHGTTIGTNALVQHRGAKVGLITTKGHEDVLHIMRGSRGYTGRDLRKVVHYSEGSKPNPVVPRDLIAGVSERVDFAGDIVVDLNESEAIDAIRHLVSQGVEAIAVCFLWSFKNPTHEQRLKTLIETHAPGVFATVSSALVPKWGEYERTTATVFNAYIGPITTQYLSKLDERLRSLGYRHSLQVMQCAGGSVSIGRAMEAPLLTLDSGPVSGVTGSQYLGELMDVPDIITTDMGGTSFDVGLIIDGVPSASSKSHVDQHEYFVPKVDIQAIGAGGGSLATFDPITNSLKVGPDSAGSLPGPICYGRGGTVPTVTDADLILGYFDAEKFAGGTMQLDFARAEDAIGKLAVQLGLSLDETAAGIARIAEFGMADLIRRATVEKGRDPRDFVLFAFGGAGPVHAGVFAREIGVKRVVIPQKRTASVWCAFGAAAADVLHVYENTDLLRSPFDLDQFNQHLADLRLRGEQQLAREEAEAGTFRFSIDIRHRGQINEIEVPIRGERLSADDLISLRENFFTQYERVYGHGAAFRNAELEAATFRVRAAAATPKPILSRSVADKQGTPAGASLGVRSVYWSEEQQRIETPVYDGSLLATGVDISGPALIETPDTTVVVRPRQRLAVDVWGNFELTFGE